MIWKNPFLSKNSEPQMGEEQFLSLFDCTALQIVNEENLEKVSFVSSSPGAGKTSLFRAFSPDVLSRVVSPASNDLYREVRRQMERLGVVEDGRVVLASAALSCARGYTIIDEMFQNGRRKQIFFALLNYRIVISLLKSIGRLLELEPGNYEQIQFAQIPQEMASDEDHFKNGKSIYNWACQGERELCKYLDSERDASYEVSFVHTTLLILKLFAPKNILVNGESYFQNVLIIFDDFHKLTDNQKDIITEAVYTLKTGIGVWFGQRLEGFKDEQLISMDGSLNRDYNHSIVIDNYWPKKKNAFYGMLEEIADRRIKEAGLEGYLKFSDSISDELESKKYERAWNQFSKLEREKIDRNLEASCIYSEIISCIDGRKDMRASERAIWYECIAIQENRRAAKEQMSLYLGEKVTQADFEAFVDKYMDVAVYYVCRRAGIPFYYGMSNLKILSSYNVEQFLYFAGAYFDCCRVKSLDYRRRQKRKLSAEEQGKALETAARQKWADMDYRYATIKSIKDFLNNIAALCIQSRDAEQAAYAGGSYTGIGVKKSVLHQCLSDPNCAELVNILGACLASKYLERRDIQDESMVLFYLNRWLCVYYGLPLAYGGWARCNMQRLISFCGGRADRDENQLEIDFL